MAGKILKVPDSVGVSHYRILEKLREGGMGVIYKAEDVKLNFVVALKFLPQGLEAHEHERERFLHETRAISEINRPNIELFL